MFINEKIFDGGLDADNLKDKTYAIIDGTNQQPGYLTDIVDKPTT